MTTQRYKRCGHCGVEYVYTGSGAGCNDPLNHPTWCSECTRVVNAALAALPKKFEGRWTNISEVPHLAGVTVERIRAWEADQDRETDARRAAGQLIARRVYAPLFNLQTGDSQVIRDVRGQGEFRDHVFKVATWRLSGETEIEVQMEYDLENQSFTGHEWPHSLRIFPVV